MEETEVHHPTRNPEAEVDWTYDGVCSIGKALDLHKLGCAVEALRSQLTHHSCLGRFNAQWPLQIFCTPNFSRTVQVAALSNGTVTADGQDNYRRCIDSVLVFPGCGQIVLLSEREADRLLPLFWVSCRSSKCRVAFANFSMLRDAPPDAPVPLVLARPASHSPTALLGASAHTTLATLQLFLGETRYQSEGRRAALRAFLHASCGERREELVDELIAMRNTMHTFARSQLERILVEAPWLHE